MFLGARRIDDLLTFYVNTHDPATGAATDDDGSPSYRVYEDETGTPLLTGSMSKLDDANTTGFYSEQITLSTANGFEVGKCYCIRVLGTVGSVAGARLFTFQVQPSASATANQIADHVLRRGWASAEASSDGDSPSFRSLLGAIAKLVNKVVVSGGTLTVYEADDATAMGTQAITTDAGADPITALDTA